MTLSYWNSQFQFSAILPDFTACLDRMRLRSAKVTLPLQRFDYGDDPRQFVEVTGAPARGGVVPVFIHGGYWRALDAEGHRFVLPALAEPTGAAANMEYRLLPHVCLADIVSDTVTGLRLVARQTGCRLLLVGHSAGGHLAVSAARLMPADIHGVLAISGLYDLEPLQWSFLRQEIGLRAADLYGWSPLENWRSRDAGHVTVAVGSDETPEFHRQARMFASSHSAKFLEVPGAHHMTVLDDLADRDGVLCAEIDMRMAARP